MEEHIQMVLDTALNFVKKEPETYSFRGSSLPYCPVRDALVKCQSSIGSLPTRNVTIKDSFILETGISIHALLQNTLGLTRGIFGDWQCKKCNEIIPLKTGPMYHCNKICDYKELRVKHPSGFSGAVDGLIPYKDGYLLIDFKTKADSFFTRENIIVDTSYRLQLFAYKYLLEKHPYNLKIFGQAIIYVARSDITKYVIKNIENDDLAPHEFERFFKLKQRSEEALITGNIASLTGLCTSSRDSPWCPYNLMCFGPNREVNLNGEWKKSAFNREKNDN